MIPIKHLRLNGRKILLGGALALLTAAAEAGPYKVYGSEFAWVKISTTAQSTAASARKTCRA